MHLSFESPESSVWPGEEFVKHLNVILPHVSFNMGGEYHPDVNESKQWLQSRTAVKAEGLRPQIADNLGQPDIDWNNDHEFRKSNQQSQPTAEGVKEEVKICKGCGVDWNISKKCWCLIPTFDQPSPSNPSIKRPTEEEINYGFNHYDFKAINHRAIWKAAINWLLSCQPDK